MLGDAAVAQRTVASTALLRDTLPKHGPPSTWNPCSDIVSPASDALFGTFKVSGSLGRADHLRAERAAGADGSGRLTGAPTNLPQSSCCP